ncbi:ATP-binding cassette domain-containing protein [Brevundimonas sp. 2R-24]|uniref:ATP-binding cassette domain-containing protein n=1 Tax=Peiella sedimenti TaxID=3061083 RepID=A0ABT8SHQ4_9CAUL|nr:ATP-binding cassette domain-containing protein [Caulobacteraceae bacterium XZ-24]
MSIPNDPLATSRPETAVVQLEGVGLRYGDAPEVLRDIDLTLPKGSFHFLTGASGAGKSSLLKLLYLAARPTRGTARLFGRTVSALGSQDLPLMRRRIGVVFQEFRLLDHLTAFDNAALPLRIAGGRARDYAADVAELLTWVGLRDRMDAYPPTLSGGEKQRLAIARAVMARPELIIADEPTGSVDQDMAVRLMRLFVELNRLGATVVIATHDNALARQSGRPVLRLDRGRLMREA